MVAETYYVRHRAEPGRVIHEFERRQLIHYATYLSDPAGDAELEPGLVPAQEV